MTSESVYSAQCKTFSLAGKMAGQYADAVPYEMHIHPPYCLRILRPYRTAEMQDFRDAVAAEMKRQRQNEVTQ